MTKRHYTPFDNALMRVDESIRAMFSASQATGRLDPAASTKGGDLSVEESKHAAGLMRVNHSGEVCAQALYHGQALTAKLDTVRDQMQEAALEEGDHLDWCHHRLRALGSHTSYLNPMWYAASFVIGALSGVAGDKWSLGFVA
jgi:ubiquinone biosynthesis monooxygenase Coq7